MQEILVVAAIVAAIVFIPRIMGRGTSSESGSRAASRGHAGRFSNRLPNISLTGWMRLAIVITFLWVAGVAAYFRPWEGPDNTYLFILIAMGPAVVLWGGIWAWFGYKKYRR